MLEKEIENQILEYLNHLGVFCWKVNSVGVYDSKRRVYRKSHNKYHLNGVADVLGILPGGRMFAVEVKSEKGRLTEAQKHFLNRLSKDGGLPLVARSIEDLKPLVDLL